MPAGISSANKETVTSMDDEDISYVKEIGLNSNWDWYPNASNHVRFGLSTQYHWYHSGRAFASSTVEDGKVTTESADDVAQGYRSFEPAVYAEDEIFLRYNLTLNERNVGFHRRHFPARRGTD